MSAALERASMNLFDRQLFLSYVKAYIICLISVISLYIVIDLFTNIEDFVQTGSFIEFLKQITVYYGYRSTQIFDRVSEALALLAAMFTVAWMQRNNELLPLLSAGVSTQRVVRPVLLSGCAMLGLTIANQEFLIPLAAPGLFRDRDDAGGNKDICTPWDYEPNGIHIEGRYARRAERTIYHVRCTIPGNICNGLRHLEAQKATYVPCGEGPHTGGWILTDTLPAELENWHKPEVLEMIDSGKYFLKTELDFETIVRGRNWFSAASTYHLYLEMCKPESLRLSAMAVLFHFRLTRPILGMLLIFLGLSVILRDQNRNVFISAGLCLCVCALFFGVTFLCKHLGNHDYLPPALAAWLPVLVFGPVAFVLFDAVHT
jgi:lipopolysaccharide export system permease protein